MKPESRPACAAISNPAHPPNARFRPQFSLASLMWAMLVIAVVCGAFRWLGTLWIVPLASTILAAASLTLAIRSGSSLRMLKLGYWHLVIWSLLSAAATGFTISGCLDYNTIAGTDKTTSHIIQISAAALAGPLVGPVANPGAGEFPQAWGAMAILLSVVCTSLLPFVLVRRRVSIVVSLISWLGYVGALVLWYFGAMISLGVFLS